MDDQWLDEKQAAKLMGMELPGLRNWVRRGRLTPWRKGNKTQYQRQAVLKAMEKYEYGEPEGGRPDPAMG